MALIVFFGITLLGSLIIIIVFLAVDKMYWKRKTRSFEAEQKKRIDLITYLWWVQLQNIDFSHSFDSCTSVTSFKDAFSEPTTLEK
jgi:hypothetical protein